MSPSADSAALERAAADDLPALLELGAEEPRPPGWAALAREQASGRLWVLRTGDGILAWGSVRLVADELHVEDLFVAPRNRRRGWGRRLLGLVLGLGRRRGALTVHLEVRRGNAPARSLYRSAGFEEIGERPDYYREPVEDAVLLRCRLAPAPES